ncbi:A/G-specific adenine glycosylase [Patescibacteria group bacterium]|nr:MAG: A/G-specific adenine glycosylase [Patescibacteria group bacterium]
MPSFSSLIWQFYKANKRPLPWRENPTPYHVFVSEIMLQQTQAPRVIPKFNAFIKTFPDFNSLAKASLSKVLKEWQGLGYNRRALYLKQSAEIIVSKYAGKLPDDPEALDELPGIGHYTTHAIVAFAFNKPTVFIETNIRSVFIHHFFKNSRDKVADSKILPLIEKHLDHTQPREWYGALMDYGAHLKSTEINPSRKSSHHVRQSKFKGSNRELRGKILKYILENGPSKQKELSKINTDTKKVSQCVSDLIKEGLLKKNKNGIEIR